MLFSLFFLAQNKKIACFLSNLESIYIHIKIRFIQVRKINFVDNFFPFLFLAFFYSIVNYKYSKYLIPRYYISLLNSLSLSQNNNIIFSMILKPLYLNSLKFMSVKNITAPKIFSSTL